MKRILAIFSVICLLLCTSVSAEQSPANIKRDIVKGVGTLLTTHGIYEDFDAENLYLEAITKVLDKNPELLDDVLKAMLECNDKYGAYYNASEATIFMDHLADNISGIGVVVTSLDGSLIISQVMPNTPAETAGLKKGDVLISANGISLLGMDLDTATSHIKGIEGTTVRLTVQRSGYGELTFDIIRATIETPNVEYEILDEKIGYIKILAFGTGAGEIAKEAVDLFAVKGIKDIIIDVRDNGGGYLAEALEIADLFLPEGAVITSEAHRIELLNATYKAKGNKRKYNTVILINEHSASASEVLTAALVENGVGTSIGVKSYGKGTIQTVANLPNGGLMKYTTAYYLTPNGNNIDGKGIKPNIEVENKFVPTDLRQFTEPKYKTTYRLGDNSPEIRYIKEMLDYIGIYQGEIDEFYGENMLIAVTAYQKALGYMEPTGNLDPMTQISILQTLSETKYEKDYQMDAAKEFLSEIK